MNKPSVIQDVGTASDGDIAADALVSIFRRSMLWTPERHVTSAWIEHTPFAFWLIDVQRPRRIVELGTHGGVSYSAMCQAVKTLGLATSCFAIDTWQGDEHAGFYGEDVYRDFAVFHEQRYGSFSRLVRSTFDDALPHFEDGSVDLLHIDGLHTYEAVKHDYQSWLGKLSANAVVLLHDTNVRERGFGVSRLWSEISTQKPHFTFLHGHGLGILGQGRDYPDALRLLFGASDNCRLASAIREMFGTLGRSVRASCERADLDQEAGLLRRRLAAREDRLAEVSAVLTERDNQISSLQQAVHERGAELVAVRQAFAERAGEVEALTRAVNAYDRELSAAREAVGRRVNEIDALQSALAAGEMAIRRQDDIIAGLLASTSWRVTAPMRFAKRLFARSVRGAGPDAPSLAKPVEPLRATHPALAPARDRPSPCDGRSFPPDPGLDPDAFDPAEYLEFNPDVKAAGVDPTWHYVHHGRAEGRLGRLPELAALAGIDPARETILIIFHDGSRTGAPILGYNLVMEFLKKYNVVALFLRAGPVLDACSDLGAVTVGPVPSSEPVLAAIVGRIVAAVPLKFAIANSIVSHPVLCPLARHFIPSITLAHEFASYIRPSTAFIHAVQWSGNIVFSSRVTADDARSKNQELARMSFPILAQGRCLLPNGGCSRRKEGGSDWQDLSLTMKQILGRGSPSPSNRPILVIGAGSVEYRKGVDLFIDCAACVGMLKPDLPIRFVWIGHGYAPESDINYSAYLADRILRAGLEQRVFFIDAVQDLRPAYAAADIFLLSSRLDPLPNVTIDALHEGIPVVCFGSGNGIAEILCQNDLGSACVARDMDVTDMASKVIALASDAEQRARVKRLSLRIAETSFNMGRYITGIEDLAVHAAQQARQEKADVSIIDKAAVAVPEYFLLPGHSQSAGDCARTYVRAWATGIHPRKLFPGFHPGIYREQHGVREAGADPLADFLLAGRPQGPWVSQVIGPTDVSPRPPGDLRTALHIHAYYPDLLQEIVEAISRNEIRPDLLISVGDESARSQVCKLLDGYRGGMVDIRVVPNRGRDLGPLFTEFREKILRDYDIIGHFHTKKSLDAQDPSAGAVWRKFLLENLLGGKAAMADRIVAEIARSRDIGLVFPDDPNVIGWGLNRSFAEPIAQRLNLGPLPEHFNFPVGSMFWADVAALNAFFKLDLKWTDYPDEPLPYDGSMLHSIERLFSFVAIAAGRRIAVTNVPGVTR